MKGLELGNFETNKKFLEKIKYEWKNIRILEIGCGNGSMTNYLFQKGANIIGVDINEKYIEKARARFKIQAQNIFQVMEGEKLDFQDKTFDIVISFDVFEHIKNSNKHLQEVRRVLKRNGIYIFGTPNKWTNIPWEIIAHGSLFYWRKYHCSLHTYKQLVRRLSRNGFSCKFINMPVVNDYFENKLIQKLGFLGRFLLKHSNLDRLPISMKSNFYIVAKKLTHRV